MSDNPTPLLSGSALPEIRKVNWPHAPPHRLSKSGSYFITASTYQKERFFHDAQRRDLLHDSLLTHAAESGWQLEAWAVFSNHYHFVARPARENLAKEDLGIMLAGLHEETAKELNKLDAAGARPQGLAQLLGHAPDL